MISTRVVVALCTSIMLVFARETAHAQTTCVSEPARPTVSNAPFRTWMSVSRAADAAREDDDFEIALVVAAISFAALSAGMIVAATVMNGEDAIPFVILGASAGALGIAMGLIAAITADARADRVALAIAPTPTGGVVFFGARF